MNELYISFENIKRKSDKEYVHLSQQEIADLAHFSKQKINKILKDSINEDYVSKFKSLRGKYKITVKGEQIILVIANFDV